MSSSKRGTMWSVFYWGCSRILTLLVFSMVLLRCDSAKILVYPVDGSHWVNMKVLIEELHSRGHSITVIRASSSWYITEKSPLYTSITIQDDLTSFADFFDEYLERVMQIQRGEASVWSFFQTQRDFLFVVYSAHHIACDMVIKILDNKELVKKLQDEQFDLVLTDPAVAGGVIIGHYLKLPMVFNARWIASSEAHFAIAPTPLSYVPVPGTCLSDQMSFLQRVKNILFYGIVLIQEQVMAAPRYKHICHKYFEPSCDIISLMQSADIWLIRADFVFEFPRPTMPNVIYISGFQCKPSKPLPDDLEAFVESSGDHGFIIMSLGTLVNSFPSEITDEIASVFARLPQKVIWKHSGDRPTTLGNNTLLVNWMPQNDLLGHPKLRAFVAHGGTNGLQEAVYHGVPVLGIPLFFDQFDNLLRLSVRGAAKILQLADLSGQTFDQALNDVLHDASYRANMQRLSRLHRDQPISPLDKAIFWIEFVMRNKGAGHLRTESYKMPWYSYHSVDVIVVLMTAMALFLFTTIAAVRYLCCRPCCKRKTKCD